MARVPDFLAHRLRVIGRDDDRGYFRFRVRPQFVDDLNPGYIIIEMVIDQQN